MINHSAVFRRCMPNHTNADIPSDCDERIILRLRADKMDVLYLVLLR